MRSSSLFCAAAIAALTAFSLADVDAAIPKAVSPVKVTPKATAVQAPTKPGWTLVFDDEFDTDSLATPASPWDTTTGAMPINGELQYYTRYAKNFSTSCDKGGVNHVFSGGTLTLRAKWEPGNYEVWHWDQNGNLFTTCEHYDYTSADLRSAAQYRYGYFETRAKVPNHGQVVWPAFWLYDGGPADYHEIDIFEFGGAVPNHPGSNVWLARQIDGGVVYPPGNTDFRNEYHSFATVPAPDVSAAFHTYAVQWTPNSITWYIDDQPVRTLAGHSPHLPMHLLLDLALAPWDPPSGLSFPQDFQIDYVRIYKSQRNEFIGHWDNGGTGKLKVWNVHADDRYVTGDFDGGDRDELLAINANGYHTTMRFGANDWQYVEGASDGKIGSWNTGSADWYVSGDFDGDNRSELLAVNPNGWHHTMKFDGGSWHFAEGGGNHKIDLWNIGPGDRYVTGDFDGNGKSELLAVNPNGWHQVMKLTANAWHYAEGAGNGKIASWNIAANDIYVTGDFDGGGKDELLAINPNGWHHTMKFTGAGWQFVEGGGDGKIASWTIGSGDRFVAGRFGGSNRDRLLAVSANGWSQLMELGASGWNTVWANDGANSIDLWRMHPADRYLAGISLRRQALSCCRSSPATDGRT
jgi:beta-glucanase (GH16 family)